jgi:hypothetical protein
VRLREDGESTRIGCGGREASGMPMMARRERDAIAADVVAHARGPCRSPLAQLVSCWRARKIGSRGRRTSAADGRVPVSSACEPAAGAAESVASGREQLRDASHASRAIASGSWRAQPVRVDAIEVGDQAIGTGESATERGDHSVALPPFLTMFGPTGRTVPSRGRRVCAQVTLHTQTRNRRRSVAIYRRRFALPGVAHPRFTLRASLRRPPPAFRPAHFPVPVPAPATPPAPVSRASTPAPCSH